MAIALPHWALFRGGAEQKIRAKRLKDEHVDTVIGLSARPFFSTGIPVCILALKKCERLDNVRFVNASEHYEKGKRMNRLRPEHIDKIIDSYQFRKEEKRYSGGVSMQEIERNRYNLNITRCVSTAEPEPEIDLHAVTYKLREIDRRVQRVAEEHSQYIVDLGLPRV